MALAPEPAARLIVIEERGTNLRLLLPDGSRVWVPERRHTGIEVLLVAAGAGLEFSVEPRYTNSPPTSFRISSHILSDAELLAAAERLMHAGTLTGLGTFEALVEACDEYQTVALDPALPREWINTATLLAVSCNGAAGRDTPSTLMEQLDSVDNTLGLFAYHADWLRGRYHYLAGEFLQAQSHYERGLEQLAALPLSEVERVGVEQDRADLTNDLAIVLTVRAYRSTGAERVELMTRAKALLNIALEIATRHQDHLVLTNIYNYIAQYHIVDGDDQGQIENLLLARQHGELLNDDDELIFILGSIGDYYKKWGHFRRALDAYLSAIRILETSSWLGRGGDSFHNLANLYHQLGDLPRAKELTNRALELFAAQGNAYRTRVLYYELGTILEEEGDLVTARTLLDEQVAYSDSRETPWEPLRMLVQAALSRVEAKLGNQERALELSRAIFDHPELLANANSRQAIPIYVNHAGLLLAHGDTAGAIALLQDALDTVATQPVDEVELLGSQLVAYQSLGQSAQARATAERAFAVIESQQSQLESARLGPYWSGKTHAVYMAHVDWLLEHREEDPGYADLAFAVTERARATGMRLRRQEMLLASTEGDPAAERQWQQLMLEAQRGLTGTGSEAEALALERRIGEARERHFVKQGDDRASAPLQPLSLEETMRKIPPETLLVEFVAGPNNLWRYDFSNTRWSVTKLGPTQQIQTLVAAASLELQQPGRRRDSLEQLSEVLLADLSLAEGPQHLLVSPTAELNAIPFAALTHAGNYLGERATLTLVPSSSEYFAARLAPESYSREIAVLADPLFGELSGTLALAGGGDVFRSWTSTLSPLPATAREAAALAEFYEEDERLILTGGAATSRSFFSPEVRNARVIHLATHGYFNEQLPELIGFALSSDGSDDGFVSMAEISTQYFNADLVVISACSTAQGQIVPGEGAMSLGRTFLAQGVNSVISTLWPVSDRATAVFMEAFYEAVNTEEASYAAALQQAQQVLRESSTYRAPAYWAAYTLTTVSAL